MFLYYFWMITSKFEKDYHCDEITNKSNKYTWSTKTSLEGWERTGKTKTENGNEICE